MPTEKVCSLEFTYDKKLKQLVEEGHWFDTYTNVVLSTGEQVGQLSIQYDFIPGLGREKGKPSIAVYFETDSGGVHTISRETTKQLQSQWQEEVVEK